MTLWNESYDIIREWIRKNGVVIGVKSQILAPNYQNQTSQTLAITGFAYFIKNN